MDIFKKWWFYVIAGLVILLLPFAIRTAMEDPADTAAPPPAQDTSAPDTSAPDTAAPDTAVPDTGAETTPATVTYVLNINTKKFHLPGCSSVRDIKDKNRQDSTLTRDELIAKGYSPCGRCKP